MRGRRPTFGNAQGQQHAVQVAAARKRRLAATQPPEPVASSDQAPRTDEVPFFSVNDQVVRGHQAEVARRAKVLEQDPSFRWPGEDEPLITLSGSPRIPPPPSPSPTPDTTPAGGSGVTGLSTTQALTALVVDTPVRLDTAVEPLPAARPEVEPDKRKKAARGPARPRTKQTTRARTRQGAITSRAGVIQHTKILIIALQEALDSHSRASTRTWSSPGSSIRPKSCG
jgi:hypothetical protein